MEKICILVSKTSLPKLKKRLNWITVGIFEANGADRPYVQGLKAGLARLFCTNEQ